MKCKKKRYDFLIVGAGLFGAVFSQQCREKGKTCLIIDQRDHIAGNCYTKNIENIDVHTYGPHIFQTNNEEVWNYANRFAKFNQYFHKVRVLHQDKIYSFPINLMTMYQLYGTKTPCEALDKLYEVRVKIDEPSNLEEWCLTQIGPELYEIFIRGYTKKQWMKDPKELPSDIIKRLPIRLTYNDNYHESKWSGIPSLGYTQWISNMIGDTPVELGVDFFQLNDWKRYGYRLVYTGKVDALFDYCYGDLEYRTLRFENQILNGDFQGVAQVNYTDETIPWTRITEHKHFNHKNQDLTVITREYPEVFSRGTTPYYPINDGKNYEIYKQYKKRLEDYPEVIGGGRLCEFKYMDMDAVIASALKKARSL